MKTSRKQSMRKKPRPEERGKATAHSARGTAGRRQRVRSAPGRVGRRSSARNSANKDSSLVARLMEISPVGVVVIDARGRIAAANQRAQEVFQRPAAEIMHLAYDSPAWGIADFEGNPFPAEQLPFARVQREGEPVTDIHLTISGSQGRRVFLSVNASPLLNDTGRFSGMVATIDDITARVEAEGARAESERRERSILDAAPFGAHLYELQPGRKLVFVGANPAADHILGVDHSTLTGKTIEDAFPGLVGTPIPDRYREVAAGGERYEDEHVEYDTAGISGAFHIYVFQTGKNRMAVFFEDITQRKRMEAQNTLLAQALKSVQDCICISDLNNRLIFVNDAFLSTYGYQETELLGNSINMVRTAAGTDNQLSEIRKATAIDGWHGEAVNRRKDGTQFPIELWTSKVRDAAGNVIASVGVAREITARKHAEEKLRDREFWLRESQRVGRIGTYDLDIHADAWVSSEVLDEIFGIEPHVVKTIESWNALVHPEDREDMRRYLLQDVVAAGQPFDREYRIVRPRDGAVRWVWGRGELSYNTSGVPVRMIGTIQDITERKQADEQIRASLREKEMLLKEVHHRVKNNMQVVSSLLSLAAARAADARARVQFEDSMTRIRSMALVHEKLYRSPSLAGIDFGDYMESVTNELLRLFSREGISCSVDAERVTLGVDIAIPCGLILNELVANALKHAFVGRDRGSVIVTLQRRAAASVELAVQDDGIGFPPELDFRAVSSMGMTLVVSLTNQIGGSVDLVRSGGTRFVVTFPA